MQVGINVMGSEALFGGIDGVFKMIALADRKGVDFLVTSDHLGFNMAAHTSRRETHRFPFVLEQPWYEPISFLSAAAAITSRIRLSTFVLVASLRPTLLLAKQLATLDVISGGRVTIGLGVGWQEAEFRAAGMPFEGRFGDLEDQIGAMRALWGTPPANAQGRNFAFEDFYSLPAPVQGADLPILLGFNPTTKNLDRIARLAQGWAVDPAHRPALAEKAAELRDLAAKHGKNPAKLEIHAGIGAVWSGNGAVDWDAVRDAAEQTVKDGATTVAFMVTNFCNSADDLEPFLDGIVGLK